jgi:hypothetical protein
MKQVLYVVPQQLLVESCDEYQIKNDILQSAPGAENAIRFAC